MTNVVIRASIIGSDIEGVLRKLKTLISRENAEGNIADSTVRNVIQRMAPHVIQIEREALRQAPLEREGQTIEVCDAGREVLLDGTESSIGRRRGQTGETGWGRQRRAVRIQTAVIDGDVLTVHPRIVHRQHGFAAESLLHFKVPFEIFRLVEHVREVVESRSGKGGHRRGNRVKAAAGMELAQERLVCL